MTIEEKRRELFEAWVSTSAWLGLGDSPDRDGEGYAECETHTAWLAFNAALDAAAIQMPNRFEYSDPDAAGAAIFDCATAIKSTGLGLKVLP